MRHQWRICSMSVLVWFIPKCSELLWVPEQFLTNLLLHRYFRLCFSLYNEPYRKDSTGSACNNTIMQTPLLDLHFCCTYRQVKSSVFKVFTGQHRSYLRTPQTDKNNAACGHTDEIRCAVALRLLDLFTSRSCFLDMTVGQSLHQCSIQHRTSGFSLQSLAVEAWMNPKNHAAVH